MSTFTAYGSGYTGGVHVAAADVNRDGRVDVITAAALPSGSRIKVFSGRDGTELANFRVSGAAFQNGITVAAADLTGDRKAEIVVGATSGGRVRTYDALTGTIINSPIGNFRAFGPGYSGAAFVGSDALAGDVDADGTPDLAVGTGAGQQSRVRVFSGATGEILHDFLPLGSGVTGGARVALAYVDNDDRADIVVGSGPGIPAAIRVFNGRTGEPLAMPLGAYAPFGKSQGGVFVAASNDPIGLADSTTLTGSYGDVNVDLMMTQTSPSVYHWEYTVTNVNFSLGSGGVGFFQVVMPGDPSPLLALISNQTSNVDWDNYSGEQLGNQVVSWSSGAEPTLGASDSAVFSFDTPVLPIIDTSAYAWDSSVLTSATGTIAGPGIPVPAPTITGMTTDTGSSNSDRITFDTTPTLSGTSEPGATITIDRQGPGDPTPVLVGTTTATGGGLWTFTYGSALADATYAFTAKATVSGVTSPASTPMNVTIDTVDPSVSLSVNTGTGNPNQTFSVQPPVTVTASDLVGFPSPATVTLDIDRNNDNDFSDANETGAATAALSGGTAVFTSYLALTPGTTVRFQARVTDLAGNEGTTSSPTTVQILSVGTPWTTIDQTARTRSGHGMLADGDVTTDHLLDLDVSAYACDCQDPHLVYHSQEAAPSPVVQAVVQSDNALGLPSQVYGTLTWDGGVIGGINYNLSQLSPGGEWVFSYAPGGNPATGRHTYSLDLFVDYFGTANDHSLSVVGDTFVINRSASPYGAGWSFSNTDTLYSIAASGSYPAGILRAFGKGGWSFYADAGGGQYTEPAGDAGTMIASGGGWVYTSPSGRVSTFDSSGRMTTWTFLASSETLTYTYDVSGGVATMKGPDGGTATFAYSSGKLATITAPGNRVTTLAYTGTDLTQITNPAAGAHTFAYSAHRLTSETYGATRVSYAYDANGLANSTTVGSASAIAPGQAKGIGTAATAGPGGSLPATLTDPLGQVWTTWFNALGQAVKTLDPMGAVRTFERDANGFVVKSIDALNRTTTFTVDSAGRVLGETRADGTSASWVYGGAYGSLTRYTDYNGGLWTYTNDANGNRLTETDPLNHTTTYTYSAGLLQTVKDATGNVTTYLYDGSRRPTGALLGGAVMGTTGYDTSGNPNTFTDARGNVTTTTYDGAGRVVGTLNPLGQRTTSAYDAGGFLLWVSDGLGRITSYAYDAAGRVEAVIEAYGTGLQRRTTSVYDAAGQLIAMVDPLGQRTTVVYDAAGRSVAMIDALGNRTTSVYDLAGQLDQTIDPLWRVTDYNYDLLGRTNAVSDPLGNVSTAVYDANSNVIATVDPLSNRSTSVYDAANRLTATVDPLGNRTSYGYDNANRLTSTTDPRLNVTTTAYDTRNRVSHTIDALNKRTTFGYDAADNRVTVTDPLNHTSTTVYDSLNRAIESINGAGNRSTVVYDAAGMVLATVDPRGNRTTTQYDALGRAEATIDALNKRATVVYDVADQVIASVDPLGNRTTFSYDAAGRMLATLDALGHRTTFGYDAAGQRVATQDAMGARTTYGYDATGRSVTVTDALSHTWTTAYDAAGRAIAATDPNGHTATTVYDNASRILATIDPLGKRTTFGYDVASNLTSVTDPLSHSTTTVYDVLNRPEATVNALNQRTTTVYDDAGNVKSVINALNHRTTYGYDAADRPITTTDAVGNVWTTAYDAAGNTIESTDPLNHTTTTVYDELNRVKAVVDPLGNRTTTTYDAAGNVQTVKNARGFTTTIAYDVLNRPKATTDALGNVWTTQYDATGNVEVQIDPLGKRTTTVYDVLNRPVATVTPLGFRTTTGYDAVGNVRTVTDPMNLTTSYGYDALDRQTTVTDPRGFVTTSIYDDVGNLTGLIDASGNRTTWVYDFLDRVETETNALGANETMAYDAAGRKSSETDRLGRRKDYVYDNVGRLLTEKWYTSGGSLVQTQTFTYDTAGRMLTAQDPDGVYTMAYDNADRVSSVQEPFAQILTFSYDENGNRTQVRDSKGGGVTTIVFDALDRQTSERISGTSVNTMRFDHSYTTRGEVERVRRYSDLAATNLTAVTSYTYDAGGRVTLINSTDGSGGAAGRFTYSYDAANRLTSKIEGANTYTYTYDNSSQLTADGAATFGYDATGNRTNAGYATGTGNRITTDGVWTYTYDAVGNVIKRSKQASVDVWDYTYDHNNQMLTATFSPLTTLPPTQRVTYAYDGWGNRIQRQEWTGGSTTTVRFAVDGWDPAKAGAIGTENFDVWARLDGSNALIARYVYGPRVDEVIGRQDPGVVTAWYLVDNQGSARRVLNNNDTVLATTSYSAYGEVTGGSVYGGYGYTGRELDAVIGGTSDAWYMRARIYISGPGRFLSEDPGGFAMGDNNLYRYVRNSPTNARDPSGMDYLAIEGEGNIVWVTTYVRFGTHEDIRFKVGLYHGPGKRATITDFGGSGSVDYDELDKMVAFGSRITAPMQGEGNNRAHRGYGKQGVQNELIKAEIRYLKSYKPAAGAGPEPFNAILAGQLREDERSRPVTPQMSATSPADIERSKRLQAALKEAEERAKHRASLQLSLSQANPGYNPDWELLECVRQLYAAEDLEKWNKLSKEEKLTLTIGTQIALSLALGWAAGAWVKPAAATTTLYHGTTKYVAAEMIQTQEINVARLAAHQESREFAKGLYTSTQSKTAHEFADLIGGTGRGGGPAVVKIEVPTEAFMRFAKEKGIKLETLVPRPLSLGQTETIIPLEGLAEFNKISGLKITKHN